MQHDNVPNDWKRLLDAAAAAYEAGIPLRPQVPARPLGLLTGLQTFNAFHTGRRTSRPPRAPTATSTPWWPRCVTRRPGARSSTNPIRPTIGCRT